MPKPPEINELVEGTIDRMTPFGFFVKLVVAPEYDSLVHISELPRSGEDVIAVDEFQLGSSRDDFRVLSVDAHQKRIALSLLPAKEAE